MPWAELPKPARPDDEGLPWWSPILGRGPLAAGALGTLLAFMVAPLATTEGALHMGGSMLKLATHGSPKLWLVMMGPLAQLALLMRRRTPRDLRGARVAAFVVALVPLAAALWAYRAAEAATAQLSVREGAAIALQLGFGGYAIVVCALVSCVAALRLGGRPPS